MTYLLDIVRPTILGESENVLLGSRCDTKPSDAHRILAWLLPASARQTRWFRFPWCGCPVEQPEQQQQPRKQFEEPIRNRLKEDKREI